MSNASSNPTQTNGFNPADDAEDTDDSKYLVFRISNEVYGTPLLDVREVIEPLHPKAVPNTVPHFKGLINLRGQIIGVVDLRVRFDYPIDEAGKTLFIVFETQSGPLAAIVDRVEAVTKFDQTQLNKKPNIRSQVPVEFLIGATSYQGGLITLIDLNKTLSSEDYVQIQKAKMATAV